jgi:hypothetical protein
MSSENCSSCDSGIASFPNGWVYGGEIDCPDVEAASGVYWGVSTLTVLNEAQILALASSAPQTDFYGTYGFVGDATTYFFWWCPDTFTAPSTITGFKLGSYPVVMATSSEGYTGSINGWSYLAVTVNGITGRLWRSFYKIGNGTTQSVIVS